MAAGDEDVYSDGGGVAWDFERGNMKIKENGISKGSFRFGFYCWFNANIQV
jgi:hypothetical protein